MRLLFEIDKRDHALCSRTFVRNSARSIILAGNRIAMVHSLKYDFYKFPGGGIEPGESAVDAMIRETREETGLAVRPETVREYGYVHRVQKSVQDPSERFVQENYYYLCEVAGPPGPQDPDAYEAEEGYALEYVEPETAIRKNRSAPGNPHDPAMLEREARVLELLLSEGLLG